MWHTKSKQSDKLHFIAVKSCAHLKDIIKKVRKPSTSGRSGPLFLSFLRVSPSLSLWLSFHLRVSAPVSLSPSLCLCLSPSSPPLLRWGRLGSISWWQRVELCRLGWDWAGNYHESKALALVPVAWAIAFSLDAVEYSRDWPRLGARSFQNPAICIESSSHTVIMWFREGRQWRAWLKTALA